MSPFPHTIRITGVMRTPVRLTLAFLALFAAQGRSLGQSAAPVTPNASLTADQLASRFLAQATFGPTPDAIAELAALHYDYRAWILREIAKPPTYALPLLEAAAAAGAINPQFFWSDNRRARSEVMLTASDQLRQRVACALSQVFVISDQAIVINAGGEGSTVYHDMLVRNAFGNFRTLLAEVARHPMMGRYLSHYRNRAGDPATGRRPDENFAREVMQLFTIGLYQLNPNGSLRLNAEGRPIETYTNADITEFARVFTGFTDEDNNPGAIGTWPNGTGFPVVPRPNNRQPMKMWEPQHDHGAKNLLAYEGARKPVLPAGQGGLQDVSDAIDNLCEHPNTAPFIARLLIQRLVTSNPSEGYLARVAAAFADNGLGVRGDLAHVITTLLLDPEARDPARILDPEHGKLREPFIRVTHLLRAFRHSVGPGHLPYAFFQFNENTLGQFPFAAPSVFNFYLPDYQPAGPIGDAGLFAPEFQIHNAITAISVPNALDGIVMSTNPALRLNLAEQESLAANPGALVANVDTLLTHGTMSARTREVITGAVGQVVPPRWAPTRSVAAERVRLAIYLTALSPDYAVLK